MVKGRWQGRWTAVLLAASVGLGGCQQFGGMLVSLGNKISFSGKPASKSKTMDETWTGSVTPQQEANVQMAMAASLENQGQVDQAIQAYLEITKKDKRRVDAFHHLALLYDRKGDMEHAKKCFATAMKLAPKDADLQCDYAYSCYLHHDLKTAEAGLRKAVALNPNLARAHNNLGMLLARTGRENEAIGEFARAGCSEAEAHANLGVALAMENRWDQANQQFQQALALDPNCQGARKGFAALQTVTHNLAAGREAGAGRPPVEAASANFSPSPGQSPRAQY